MNRVLWIQTLVNSAGVCKGLSSYTRYTEPLNLDCTLCGGCVSDGPQQAIWFRAGVLCVLQESAGLQTGAGHHTLSSLVSDPYLYR